MESNGTKLNFAASLKANNIAVSMVSLNEYSKQIKLFLSQIDIEDSNEIAKTNKGLCLDTIEKSLDTTSSINILDEYIRFGECIPFLLHGVNKNSDNIKLFKQIAICYLDIAKILKDERVNRLSFAFADELINNDNK